MRDACHGGGCGSDCRTGGRPERRIGETPPSLRLEHRLLSTKQITAFSASFTRIIKRNALATKLKNDCQ